MNIDLQVGMLLFLAKKLNKFVILEIKYRNLSSEDYNSDLLNEDKYLKLMDIYTKEKKNDVSVQVVYIFNDGKIRLYDF